MLGLDAELFGEEAHFVIKLHEVESLDSFEPWNHIVVAYGPRQ